MIGRKGEERKGKVHKQYRKFRVKKIRRMESKNKKWELCRRKWADTLAITINENILKRHYRN